MGPSKTHSFLVTLTIPETSNRRKRKAKARSSKRVPAPKPTKKPARKASAKPNAEKNITLPTEEEKREARNAYERERNKLPERKENNRRYSRQWPALAKELGLCVGCHGIPLPNRTRCQRCTERHRGYRRRAKESDRCTDCASPPLPNRTRCSICTENRRKPRQRAKKRAAGARD